MLEFDIVLDELSDAGLSADDPVLIQSFEVGVLQRLNQRSDFELAQLVGASGGPADEPSLRYADMIAPSGLEEIALYADRISANIRLILNPDGTPTSLVADATEARLKVDSWTLRKENAYLPTSLKSEGGEAASGDMASLWNLLAAAGVNGVITDDPGLARAARDAELRAE